MKTYKLIDGTVVSEKELIIAYAIMTGKRIESVTSEILNECKGVDAEINPMVATKVEEDVIGDMQKGGASEMKKLLRLFANRFGKRDYYTDADYQGGDLYTTIMQKGGASKMSNLTHLFKVGQKVKCRLDGEMFKGTVKEVYADHIIVDVPEVSDHCWFENGFNMDCIYPEYNFQEVKNEQFTRV